MKHPSRSIHETEPGMVALRLAFRWREPPRASLALTVVLGVFYLLTVVLQQRRGMDALLFFGANFGPWVDAGQYWRLLSCTFLHANSFHLFMNGSALLILGTMSERVLGWQRFLLVYAIAGLGGSIASWKLADSPSVGASGALMGLLGAMTVFGLRYGRHLPNRLQQLFGPTMWANLLIMLALGIFSYLLRFPIDNYAHAGGLVAGSLVAVLLGTEVDPRRAPGRLWPLLLLLAMVTLAVWWRMFQEFFILLLQGRSQWG